MSSTVNESDRPYADIVVFDTETNGLDVNTDDMLSIAWVKIRKYLDDEGGMEFISRAEHFVYNDQIKNNPVTYAINRISDEFRHCYGEPVEDILNAFKTIIRNSYCFAFNIEFDKSFVCKYDQTMFDEALELVDIRVHEQESVLNSLQRIVYHYYKNFNHWVYITDHLHSAFDDVMAELVIMLFDVFEEDVRSWLVPVDEFVPAFAVGKYKGQRVDQVLESNENFVNWFVFSKDSKYENYLRRYLLSHWKPTNVPPAEKLSAFGHKVAGI